MREVALLMEDARSSKSKEFAPACKVKGAFGISGMEEDEDDSDSEDSEETDVESEVVVLVVAIDSLSDVDGKGLDDSV